MQTVTKSLTASALLLSVMAASTASAAIFTWDAGGANTRLSTAGNWDSAPGFGNDADLVFNNSGGPGSTYTNITARSLTFDSTSGSAQGFGINRSTLFQRYLTMSADTGNASMTVEAGVTENIAITGTFYNPTSDNIQNAVVLASDLDITNNGSGTFDISARITGANDITTAGAGTVRFGSAQNDYTGNTIINGDRLTLLSGANLFFDIGASGVNNSLSGTGDAILNGDFRFDLSSAGTTIGDSWQIINIATLSESFEDSFTAESTNGSFTETAGVWSISENGIGYEFSELTGVLTAVVPEPSSYALLAGLLGLSAVMVRRRK